MNKLDSKIDLRTTNFVENQSYNLKLEEKYLDVLGNIGAASRAKALKKHTERGKVFVHDRINLLTDRDTPFMELSSLAAIEQYNNDFPSAGIITGIGLVHKREVMIIANDATVKGGTYIKETIKKHVRAQKIALENNLPCIYLVDSGGIFLPEQSKVFPDKDDFGKIFYNQAHMSALGVPQISVVMGSCTAGGAYVPAMSDETIIVKNTGTIFIGGPPLVKAATGEDVSAEELGGAFVHTSISGLADHIAENDEEALEICRSIIETLPIPEKQKLEIKSSKEPLYNIEELYGIVPKNSKELIDPREIIMRIVDNSEFHEFKPQYGKTMVTGFARIMGIPVGIIANQGVLFSESALKGTHFIELCNFRKTPLIFLQNITGFIVGKQYEHKGIAKDGAKLVSAVANANVPKITLITGGSFGAGNYAMAGRAFNPRFLFMWPNANISVMGGEQAANVLLSLKKTQIKHQNKELSEKEEQKLYEKILHDYSSQSSAYYSTSRIWDDGIIKITDTRKVLAMCLSVSLNKTFPDPKHAIYRM